MIRFLLSLYAFVIILDWILGYLPDYRKTQWGQFVVKLANYSLAPIRKLVPPDLPIDPSPAIVLILIQLIKAIW